MKKPTKKDFYSFISKKHNIKFKDLDSYNLFLEAIEQAQTNEDKLSEFLDIVSMSKTDRLIYRNTLAENGKELTPTQVDILVSIIGYALDHVH